MTLNHSDENPTMNTTTRMKKKTSLLATAGALAIGLLALGAIFTTGRGQAQPVAPASDIPKVDTKGMLPTEVESLKRLLEKFPSACGKSHSLLTSLRTDAKCGLSVVAARWVQKLLSDGFLESEVEEKYNGRFVNAKCYNLDIAEAPVRGNPSARVTIVEFSDFECPHCRMAEPWLKQILDEYPKDVKLVFMNYPLSNHPNATNAAAAAVAAGKQKKFWAYHDKLFDNQEKLRMPDLIRYAEELKLDVERFKADLETAKGPKGRVSLDKQAGEKADITGTPSIYINCRMAKVNSVDTLRSYVEAELAR
jgi:protein-disulfide isomerase